MINYRFLQKAYCILDSGNYEDIKKEIYIGCTVQYISVKEFSITLDNYDSGYVIEHKGIEIFRINYKHKDYEFMNLDYISENKIKKSRIIKIFECRYFHDLTQ